MNKQHWRDWYANACDYARTLFDFSFSRYLTIQLLPLLYGILIVASGALVIDFVFDGFSRSTTRGIIYTLLAPLAFIVLVSACRSILELYLVIFRIAEEIKGLGEVRETVDKFSDISDMAQFASKLPFIRLLRSSRRPPESSDSDNSSR